MTPRKIGVIVLVGGLIALAALNEWIAMAAIVVGSFAGAWIASE